VNCRKKIYLKQRKKIADTYGFFARFILLNWIVIIHSCIFQLYIQLYFQELYSPFFFPMR